MSLIDRYLFKTVATAIFAVLLVILGVDFLAAMVSEMEDLSGRYTLFQALIYIVLKIPRAISEYAGYSALIGAMIGLGLFSNSGELTVIRATGVSAFRIGWMVMKPALVLIFMAAILSEFVAPPLEQKAESQRNVLRGKEARLLEKTGLWLYDQGTYVHVEAVYPDGRLVGLSRYQIDLDDGRLDAEIATLSGFDPGSQVWTDENVRRSSVNFEESESEQQSLSQWSTDLSPELLNMSVLTADQMSVRDLSRYSSYLGNESRRSRDYKVEFWRKLLAPLSIAALVFVGISFVFGSNRQVAVGERIFVGVVVGTIFQLLQDIFGPASVVWGFTPLAAVLVPIGFTLLAGVIMLRWRS